MEGGFFESVATLIQAYWKLSLTVSLFIGIVLTGKGLMALDKRRQDGGGVAVGITGILLGVAFINLPWWINMWSFTLMGVDAASDPLAYSAPSGATNPAAAEAIVMLIRAVGLYGTIKALLLFHESHFDRTTFWPAWRHFLAGIFLLNITAAAEMLIPFVPTAVQGLLHLFV